MKTILIVEDEVETADMVREVLEQAGYRAIVAHDGRDGLSKIESEEPDLVITDMMMPILDGAELIARLNGDPATRHVPVIAVSGTEQVEHRPFLRKPFALDELLDEVSRQLAGGATPAEGARDPGDG
jgi:CheY-like chemotaxis protein